MDVRTKVETCHRHREQYNLPPAPEVDMTEYKCERDCTAASTCPLLIETLSASLEQDVPPTMTSCSKLEQTPFTMDDIQKLIKEMPDQYGLVVLPGINCLEIHKIDLPILKRALLLAKSEEIKINWPISVFDKT